MVNTFEKLLSYALSKKSTDVHFEMSKRDNETIISMRTINGFEVYDAIDKAQSLLEYLKYISNLDLTDINKPQSGAFSYIFNDHEYFFRLANVHTLYKEICVLRIINQFYIDGRIFKEIHTEIKDILKMKSGLVVFSGLTGSGKTTSMYTLMHMFKNKKVYSIEDPIEVFFDSVVQLDLNLKRNFGYEEAITQVLRHDPDVICIGEIRDSSAAHMAITAAYTGHLVICTIHARNVEQTIARLIDLGVTENQIHDNLVFVANQKLEIKDNERYSVYEVTTY